MLAAIRRSRPPAWFALYLLSVIAVTLFPFWLHCTARPLLLRQPLTLDLIQNVVLFIPFGVALRRAPLLLALAAALATSGVIELAQPWMYRSVNPWDVAANGGGTLVGWLLPLRFGVAPRAAHARLAALAAVGLLLSGSVWTRVARTPNDFSNWEPMPLVIGNEATSDRPWTGSIAELAVFDRAPDAAPDWGNGPPRGWSEGGPILWMRFQPPRALRLDGPDGARELPLPAPAPGLTLEGDGLHATGPVWRLPDELSAHLMRRLQPGGQIAVYARLRPARLDARGPARIVSLSSDPGHRNFTLAQNAADITWRVRTPTTGLNGGGPEVVTHGAPLTRGEHRVWAVFAGETSRVEVDGACRGERFVAVSRDRVPLVTLALSLVAGTGLAAFAAGAGSRERGRRRARCVAGGVAFWGVLWAIGTWAHLPYFGAPALALGAAATWAAMPMARAASARP